MMVNAPSMTWMYACVHLHLVFVYIAPIMVYAHMYMYMCGIYIFSYIHPRLTKTCPMLSSFSLSLFRTT